MIKAVIFDLDGTLVNTLNSIAYFANAALHKYGCPKIEVEKYRYLVGRGADILVKGMLETVNSYREDLFYQVRDYYNETYDNDYMYLASPYDGIHELISWLKENHIKTAVLSNKPHETTVKIVEELFGKQIDICYGKREGVPRKPDPTALLEVIKELEVDKKDCIYVGDTSTDMKTGKNGQLFTVGVTWGFRDRNELEEYHADLIIDHPNQLKDWIQTKTPLVQN
ncbi:HAD family hydrolase [Paludicola sp. MB14-C6]|uniref:HAD family hydrolase n=1 Tax=Paludihabitans sp. MB14-C6 TaxID=3070656 RepID=UPI0027DAF0DD|nr:HAD family hydrolase [Paludicola sp. MB14-C6]WMJ24406.1 HAD family hydrolase [Paludicola sp. MB14-C6]